MHGIRLLLALGLWTLGERFQHGRTVETREYGKEGTDWSGTLVAYY